MAKETIVFAQGIEMPPTIQALAQSMKPAEFALRALPPTAKPDEIAARHAGCRVPRRLSAVFAR